MKHIKTYKESLEFDFQKALEEMSDFKEYIINFYDSLKTNKDKSEFMYKISDGENVIETMIYFLNQDKVLNKEKFKKIISEKEENLLFSKYDKRSLIIAIGIIKETSEIGFERATENIDDMILNNGIDPDKIKIVLSEAIDYLNNYNRIENWKNNKFSIEPSEEVIIAYKLIEYIDDYYKIQ